MSARDQWVSFFGVDSRVLMMTCSICVTPSDTPISSAVVGQETIDAQQSVAQRLGKIGFVLAGTITQRMRRCGEPNCHCATNPQALHGPYIQWTRVVDGKTVTKQLRHEQFERYQPWFADARLLRGLTAEFETLSLNAIHQAEGRGAKT